MRKFFTYLLVFAFIFLLTACTMPNQNTNNNTNDTNEDTYVEEEPVLVDDSELMIYDDILNFYDNKMKVNGGTADPFILRFNGYYYLYATNGNKYLLGFKSKDLYSWEPVDNGVLKRGYVYDYSYDEGHPNSQTPYAPEVIYFNGKFYLITSPLGNGHYVLESDSPEGPFVAISSNIGMSIDGHYFIDGKDEKIYLFTSGTSGITGYELEDNMYTVKKDENGNNIKTYYLDCQVGKWTEGPYMLQKNGNYYFTYTGTHYLSASYRVNYAYADKNSDIIKAASLKEMDTILLSTTDEFRGLGHSSTVLGHDMDSYYIVYHNLEQNNSRNLNYSRLSFNGSTMVADSVKTNNNPGFEYPPFATHDLSGLIEQDGLYLSEEATSDTFTVEFNTVGEGQMVFSYIDNSNYSYIEFLNNEIAICKVTNDETKTIHTIPLIREYRTDVLHTFRLQYAKGKLSLYFDTMEKAYDIKCNFKGGQIGYFVDNEFSEIGYTAFSNVALGSSDSLSYNTQVSLANAYDKRLSYLTTGSSLVPTGNKSIYYVSDDSYNLVIKNEGNRATYRTYLENEQYSIEMRLPYKYAGTKIGLQFDGGEIQEIYIPDSAPTEYKKGDMSISLGVFDIEEGQHNISIYNVGDEIAFSELRYVPVNNNSKKIQFNGTFDTKNFFTKNNINLTKNGFETQSQTVCGLITKENYFNSTINASLVINEVPHSGYAGIVFNSSAYSNYPQADADGVDFPYPYCGFLLSFTYNEVVLDYVEFKNTVNITRDSFTYVPGQLINISITQTNNNYVITINGEEIFDINANVCSLSGGVGVFSQHANVYFKSLSVSSNLE